jgi:oxygen-independent coproporphyrinogen-3 oxidase
MEHRTSVESGRSGLTIIGNGAASPSEETTAGNYFVSNYPPYAYWSPAFVDEAFAALDRAPAPETPLGVYLHIPFCRKRCHFCYFKVYTDKNASEVDQYLDAALEELALFSVRPVIGGRRPRFVYFGGGTPSYISSRQLTRLVEGMKRLLPWDEAEEVTFECEPGTLTEGKLRTIRDLGVTRLSLGVENFDDEILQANGRAHASREIGRAYDFARSIDFPQINIDLIAGMVGETDENWRECVRKTIAMDPDSITIYQMEVPYNTTIFKEMRQSGAAVAPVAAWNAKREWVQYAFSEFEKAGYTVGSAYTVVKDPARAKFLYRDLLWQGADLLGVGVASFSHVQGTHFQNESDFGPYCDRLRQGALPIARALTPTADQRLIRELILQMKLGRLSTQYFRDKFGVDIQQRFAVPVKKLESQGYLKAGPEQWRLSREGLLRVDRLLHEFFQPEHLGPRYA